MNEAFVIPLKRLDQAKLRLRSVPELDVTALAERLATAVIKACAPRPVIVVSEHESVTTFALSLGATVLTTNESGLNPAVQSAYSALLESFGRLIVVHGDLRDPTGLGDIAFDEGITIYADHHGRGTNVLALPTGLNFHFGYGDDSLAHHVGEAKRLAVTYRVIIDSPYGFDIDVPDDLESA